MIALLLFSLSAMTQEVQAGPSVQAAPPAPALDTTIAVGASTRLRVESAAGRITIKTWAQSAVRVVATPRPGTTVHFDASPALFNVWASANGRIDEVDYVLTIPRAMDMTLGSGDVAIDIADAQGSITAKNYSGTIKVTRSRGALSLKSVMDEVSVDSAVGRVNAQSDYGTVRLTDVTGDVEAGSSMKHVYLTRVDARVLSASTVGGVVYFSGTLRDDGQYAFVAHAGSIMLSVREPVNATLSVSTVSGAFSSEFAGARTDGPRRGRFSVKIGSGAAAVDLQSFSGGMVIKHFDPNEKPRP